MAFLLQGSVANLFFDFLISHPNHFVRFQVGQFQIYLIIDNLFFFVAVDDAIDGSLQHEIGTQFQSPFFSCLRQAKYNLGFVRPVRYVIPAVFPRLVQAGHFRF